MGSLWLLGGERTAGQRQEASESAVVGTQGTDNVPEAAWQQWEGSEAVGSWVFWLDSGSQSTLRWGQIQGVGVRMKTERQVNTGKRQARFPTPAWGIPGPGT